MTGETETVVTPLTPLRKMIADRMTLAKQTVPHYRLTTTIEMEALLALRQSLNNEPPWQDSDVKKLSINDFIVKAIAQALMDEPAINVQFIDNEIHQFSQADIAVITAIDGGVTTPVLRKVNSLSVVDIAREIKALVAKAKAGQLKMREITGGTLAVSNLGMFGIEQFDAIINPPQCAIVAIGAVQQQVRVKQGEAVITPVIKLTLSLDHRVIDGAVGAQFLAALKHTIEQAKAESFL